MSEYWPAAVGNPEGFQQLEAEGVVKRWATPSIDWLGTPLRTAKGVIGVLAYKPILKQNASPWRMRKYW